MNTTIAPKLNLVDKMHLHVLATHFPMSLFGVAFGFQILHLFFRQQALCFEVATNITLVTAAVMMIPTTLTGWLTWKSRYKGARVIIFQQKITITFTMLAFSVALAIWRVVFFGIAEDVPNGTWHWLYLAGNTSLIAGRR